MKRFPSFEEFFCALWTDQTGESVQPFPWQRRLAETVLDSGWPQLIALPTGTGKTSIVDIWLWALAAGAAGLGQRQPRRLFFVIDRRIVVDSVFERARFIAKALEHRETAPTREVASALLRLGGSQPLLAARLRGGLEIDPAWAEDLAQPLVCASTVDQVGSRLLFRGYGLAHRRRNPLSIHAALVGNDALIAVDEAHLSVPFDETLEAVEQLRRLAGRRLDLPWHCLRMTATPRPGSAASFSLDAQDEADQRLKRRLSARKPARLVEITARGEVAETMIVETVVKETCALLDCAALRTLGVVVNRVARARSVADSLQARHLEADVLLLIGPSRPADHDRVLAASWSRLRAGRRRDDSARRLIVVATQTIEVGADLDFDALVTECAPADCLRQRFGRLDRLGELEGRARAVVLYAPTKAADPIYGSALEPTWKWLQEQATDGIVDVGPQSLADPPVGALAPVTHAPILFPAYIDRFSQTSPLPSPDPAVSVFLHGFETRQADVEIVWRTDLDPSAPSHWRNIVALLPPTGREALRVSFAAALRWLRGLSPADLADVEGGKEESAKPDSRRNGETSRDLAVLRWCGAHDEDTRDVSPSDLRPGDTIVVPASYGGCDLYGWAPGLRRGVFDLAESVPAERDDLVLRLHPSVLAQYDIAKGVLEGVLVPDEDDPSLLVPDLAGVEHALSFIADTNSDLARLARALLGTVYDVLPYPDGAESGGVLIARRDESGALGDDNAQLGGAEVSLREHQDGVVHEVVRMAQAVELEGSLVRLIAEAGRRHDEGKRDPRFQRLLTGGSSLAPEEPLAKGRVRLRDVASQRRAWREAGLPGGFRHEAASTALIDGIVGAADDDLVRHLVASHHGCARPFLPVVADSAAWIDTSGLERVDGEVSERFWRLIRCYGWWGLAYLEATLRLADHRQSARERS
jgi:CRISPR-associated endonuclease/helicase Cas3